MLKMNVEKNSLKLHKNASATAPKLEIAQSIAKYLNELSLHNFRFFD